MKAMHRNALLVLGIYLAIGFVIYEYNLATNVRWKTAFPSRLKYMFQWPYWVGKGLIGA